MIHNLINKITIEKTELIEKEFQNKYIYMINIFRGVINIMYILESQAEIQ